MTFSHPEIRRSLSRAGCLILLLACLGGTSDGREGPDRAADQPGASPSQPSVTVDSAIQDYLEGIWVSGKDPEGSACIANWIGDGKTEVEFEFRKTGGRALIFEPFDLFSAIELQGIEADRDTLKLTAKARTGASVPYLTIRKVDHERFEIVGNARGGTGDPPEIYYRCGGVDLTVNSGVALEQLSWLTPPWSGSESLIEVQPDIDDRDLCTGNFARDKSRERPRILQFEVLGPVHYWVFGTGWEPMRVEFDYIRRITQVDDHSLELVLQEHSHTGKGWDPPGASGRTYEWTVIDRGERVEIPEIGVTFVRCRRDDPLGLGAHRWG